MGILIAKISGSAERQMTPGFKSKSKQVSKKLKESDRNEKIELFKTYILKFELKQNSKDKRKESKRSVRKIVRRQNVK